MNEQKATIRFVHEKRGFLFRKRVSHVPRKGDEIRLGGEGNEKYFEVTCVIWVFDEDTLGQRVNIGVIDAPATNAKQQDNQERQ